MITKRQLKPPALCLAIFTNMQVDKLTAAREQIRARRFVILRQLNVIWRQLERMLYAQEGT